jgi:hypothetical protein
MNSIRRLFSTSVAVAAIGPVGILLLRHEVFLGVALAAIPVWIVMFVAGVRRFGKQGLWLLLVAPRLWYVPYLFWELSRACAQNINACP